MTKQRTNKKYFLNNLDEATGKDVSEIGYRLAYMLTEVIIVQLRNPVKYRNRNYPSTIQVVDDAQFQINRAVKNQTRTALFDNQWQTPFIFIDDVVSALGKKKVKNYAAALQDMSIYAYVLVAEKRFETAAAWFEPRVKYRPQRINLNLMNIVFNKTGSRRSPDEMYSHLLESLSHELTHAIDNYEKDLTQQWKTDVNWEYQPIEISAEISASTAKIIHARFSQPDIESALRSLTFDEYFRSVVEGMHPDMQWLLAPGQITDPEIRKLYEETRSKIKESFVHVLKVLGRLRPNLRNVIRSIKL